MEHTRTVIVTNAKGEEIKLVIVGKIIRWGQPIRRLPKIEPRRERLRRERAFNAPMAIA